MNKFFSSIVFLFFVSAPLRAQDNTEVSKRELSSNETNAAEGTYQQVDSVGAEHLASLKRKWAFGLSGGYSYRLPNKGARTNTPYSKYLRNLKSG